MSTLADNLPRLLIVDDNKKAVSSLATLLETAGYQVQTACDGTTALKVAEQFAPQACVLDINMPGMSGYELARRLRDLVGDRPLVLATVTGYGDLAHLDRAADAGFDLHFTKPVDPTELVSQLDDSLAQEVSCGH